MSGADGILVGAVALNQKSLAWDWNFANIFSALHLAKREGVDLVLLPHMAITGAIDSLDDVDHVEILERTIQMIRRLRCVSKPLVVGIGLMVPGTKGWTQELRLLWDDAEDSLARISSTDPNGCHRKRIYLSLRGESFSIGGRFGKSILDEDSPISDIVLNPWPPQTPLATSAIGTIGCSNTEKMRNTWICSYHLHHNEPSVISRGRVLSRSSVNMNHLSIRFAEIPLECPQIACTS